MQIARATIPMVMSRHTSVERAKSLCASFEESIQPKATVTLRISAQLPCGDHGTHAARTPDLLTLSARGSDSQAENRAGNHPKTAGVAFVLGSVTAVRGVVARSSGPCTEQRQSARIPSSRERRRRSRTPDNIHTQRQ